MDDTDFSSIMEIYGNTLKIKYKEEKESQNAEGKVIRRPAGDDWF